MRSWCLRCRSHGVNRPLVLFSFFNNLFYVHERTSENKPQRTDDKIPSPLKIDKKYNERRHPRLAATGLKMTKVKGDTFTKVPKPTFPLTFFSLLLNKLFHDVYNSPQKKRERTEYISRDKITFVQK